VTRARHLAGPLGLFAAGTVLTVAFDPVWTRVLGITALLAFVVLLFSRVAVLGAGDSR
jgi:hypothetical protein